MKMVMIFNLHVVVISYTQSVIHLVSLGPLPPKNNLPLGTYIVWGTPIITYIGDHSITPPLAMLI